MKGLTFDTFINHPTNQNAYDMCFKLARFEGERKSPIVLLGDSGAGKSHLLWAIVNHYRSNRVPVGIALISATDFPAKVKDLAVVPDKLTSSMPVVLLVDDLQRFEKDMEDLEKVVFAVHEHGHTVVFATQVHPNVMSKLSGKFKALLGSGVIIGMKPLPKAQNSAIPEAALQQIATLKRRISELESGEITQDAALDGHDKDETLETAGLHMQLEELRQERDGAIKALDQSREELRAFQEQMRDTAAITGVPSSDADAWQETIGNLLARLENQKDKYESRLNALEAEAENLLNLAASLQQDASPDGTWDQESSSDVSDELARAQRTIALQTEEMDRLRTTSKKLAEALERQESEVNTVISGIRETVAHLSSSASGQDGNYAENAGGIDSQGALNAIAEQLQALDVQFTAPSDNGQPHLFNSEDHSEGAVADMQEASGGAERAEGVDEEENNA